MNKSLLHILPDLGSARPLGVDGGFSGSHAQRAPPAAFQRREAQQALGQGQVGVTHNPGKVEIPKDRHNPQPETLSKISGMGKD